VSATLSGAVAQAAPVARPGAIVISYSELDAYKQCPHKWQLAYEERWTKAKDEKTAAGRGTMWHQMLDSHYTALKEGGGASGAKAAVRSRVDDFYRVGKDHEVIDLLQWMYQGYVEKWGYDDAWEVLVVEYKAIVPLKYPDGRLSEFDLKMIIDLVVRDRSTGRVWIVDHKSHADIPKDKELDLEDQFGLYTWGLRELGHKIFGCVYNTARTKRNKGDHPELVEEWRRRKAAGEKPGPEPKPQPLDGRYDRYLMSRTETETFNLAQDALMTARNMHSEFNGRERHTNGDTCKWRCDYTEACLIGRKTTGERERQFLLDVGYRQDYTRH
jgi:hypothetical protein